MKSMSLMVLKPQILIWNSKQYCFNLKSAPLGAFFLFTKNRIELKGEYDTSDLEGERQTYRMDVVNNKQ